MQSNKDAVQKAASVVTGQLTSAAAIGGLILKSKYISLLERTVKQQNAAVIFLQCSDKHQHSNSKFTDFGVILLKCTYKHTLIHTQKESTALNGKGLTQNKILRHFIISWR